MKLVLTNLTKNISKNCLDKGGHYKDSFDDLRASLLDMIE
jgi:hypothetical protein